MEAVRNSGLDFSMLQPSVMFGQGAGFIVSLLRSIRMVPLIVPIAGDGKTRLQPIWVGDVVTCVMKLVAGEKRGETCQIGGPDIVTYDALIDEILRALGVKKTKIHVPKWLMRPGVAVMDVFLRNPPVTMVEFKSMEIPNVTDPDAVEKDFGFKPRHLRDGLGYLKIRV